MYIIDRNTGQSHQITDIVLRSSGITVSLTTTLDAGPGMMAAQMPQQIQIPSIALAGDYTLAVAEWLVGPQGNFKGGIIATNEEFPFIAAQAELRRQVKAKRNALQEGGCGTPSGRIDTDANSLTNLNGAVVQAMLQQAAFSVSWRMADNVIVTGIDAQEMIAIGLAVATHRAACQARKNELDAEIDAATTIAELHAIGISDGWPE